MKKQRTVDGVRHWLKIIIGAVVGVVLFHVIVMTVVSIATRD